MTSNTAPSGTAFSSGAYSGNYEAWYAFNQLDDVEGFASISGSGGVGFLGYIFPNKIIIGKYSVRSVSDTILIRMPKDWTFEGSNDTTNGQDGTWTVLDKQENQYWATGWVDNDYVFKNTRPFKAYRLNWTANGGNPGYTDVNELKMYEAYDLGSTAMILESSITGKPYSLEDKVLVHIPNVSNATISKHGIRQWSSVELNVPFTGKRYVNTETTKGTTGKIFMQTIGKSLNVNVREVE